MKFPSYGNLATSNTGGYRVLATISYLLRIS